MTEGAAARAEAFYDAYTQTILDAGTATFQASRFELSGDDITPEKDSNLELAKRAGITPGLVVADLGCGVCGPGIDIASAYPDVTWHGVTVSNAQVEIGRERIAAAGLGSRVQVFRGDYHQPPLEPGTYDLVVFFESLGYTENLPALLRTARTLLKPGGRLYAKDMFVRPGELTDQARADLRESESVWQTHKTPTFAEAEAAASQAGFRSATARNIDHLVSERHALAKLFTFDAGGLRKTPFGELFFRPYVDLPVITGELVAVNPGLPATT